ncbi:MAG: hypothetical protein KIS85_06265 [Anaerolineales bacterium]|nr:hypothetical protein [Anaerolineales bacterium]
MTLPELHPQFPDEIAPDAWANAVNEWLQWLMANSGGGGTVELINRSGETQPAGAVVIFDGANDQSFTVTDRQQDRRAAGILLEETEDEAAGKVLLLGGPTLVRVDGPVKRGEFIGSGTTEGDGTGLGSFLWLAGAVAVAVEDYAGPDPGMVSAVACLRIVQVWEPGIGYVAAGLSSTSVGMLDLDEYNPDTWTQRADMPSPARYGAGGAGIDGVLVVTGGADSWAGSSKYLDVDEYTPGANSWASKTDLPSPARLEHWVTVIAGKLVSGFGVNASSYYADLDEYTHGTDSWASKTDGPTGRAIGDNAPSPVSGKGYFIGGRTSGGAQSLNSEYDLGGDSWTAQTALISPARHNHGGMMLADRIYVAGGSTTGLFDNDELLPPGTWTSKTNTPSPARVESGTAEIGGRGYLMYGAATWGSGDLQDCDEYNPSGDSWTNKTNGPNPVRGWAAGMEV